MVKLYYSAGKEDCPEGFRRAGSEAPESVDEVLIRHFAEQVVCLPTFVDTIYRMLKPGGKVVIEGHYYGCVDAYTSPLNRRVFSERSFNWTNKAWREASAFTEFETDADFEVAIAVANDPALSLRADDVQHFWRTNYLNAVKKIIFTLTKK